VKRRVVWTIASRVRQISPNVVCLFWFGFRFVDLFFDWIFHNYNSSQNVPKENIFVEYRNRRIVDWWSSESWGKRKKNQYLYLKVFFSVLVKKELAIESFCFLFCFIPQVLFKNGISRNCGEITGIMTMLMFSDFF